MRLIKCRKCGTTVTTDNTVLESMLGQMNEHNNKSLKAKSNRERKYHADKSQQLSRLITQIQHRESQAAERKSVTYSNLYMLKRFVIDNDLMTYEQLDKIEEEAKLEAKERARKEAIEIEKLYGSRHNITSNRTNKDDTFKKALKNLRNSK